MEWNLLRLRLQMEQLITQREAMIAANAARSYRGEAQAYTEDAFTAVVQQLTEIESRLRNL